MRTCSPSAVQTFEVSWPLPERVQGQPGVAEQGVRGTRAGGAGEVQVVVVALLAGLGAEPRPEVVGAGRCTQRRFPAPG
jgi:hypothetical protein